MHIAVLRMYHILPTICLHPTISAVSKCVFVTIIVLLVLSVVGIPLAIVMIIDGCKAMKGILYSHKCLCSVCGDV